MRRHENRPFAFGDGVIEMTPAIGRDAHRRADLLERHERDQHQIAEVTRACLKDPPGDPLDLGTIGVGPQHVRDVGLHRAPVGWEQVIDGRADPVSEPVGDWAGQDAPKLAGEPREAQA